MYNMGRKESHSFVEGDQHLRTTTQRHWSAQHVTACFVLQNDAGAQQWPATEQRLDGMKRAFQDRTEH
jgi:hypothetical protein|eukprot:COSAG06_NODE_6692_length_2822_cov_7.096585_3_plen_68_part_00